MNRKAVALITMLLITLMLIVSFLSMKNVTEAPQLEWSKIFTRPPRTVTYAGVNYAIHYHDRGSRFVQTSDGGYAVVATLEDSYTPPHTGGIHNYTGQIIKTDSSGIIEWEKKDYLLTEARSIYQTRDGGYIVVTSAGLLKMDNQGNIQWNNKIGASAYRAIQADDGDYTILAGESGEGVVIRKVDENGYSLWNLTVNAPAGQDLSGGTLTRVDTFDVAETGNGGYVATGTWLGRDYWRLSTNLWLISTDSNGKLQFHKTYNLFNVPSGSQFKSVWLFSTKIYVTRNDGFILCGLLARREDYRNSPWLAKISPYGTIEWALEYGEVLNGTGHFASVVQTGDGGFFAVGSFGSGLDAHPLLVKTDQFGNVQWSITDYAGFLGNSYVSQGMVTNEGAYVVVGKMNDSVWLAKFAADEPEPPFSSYVVLIAAGVATVAVASIGLLVYFKKRKRSKTPLHALFLPLKPTPTTPPTSTTPTIPPIPPTAYTYDTYDTYLPRK